MLRFKVLAISMVFSLMCSTFRVYLNVRIGVQHFLVFLGRCFRVLLLSIVSWVMFLAGFRVVVSFTTYIGLDLLAFGFNPPHNAAPATVSGLHMFAFDPPQK